MKYLSVHKLYFFIVIIIFFNCVELWGQFSFRYQLAGHNLENNIIQLQKDVEFSEPKVDKPSKKLWIYGVGTVVFGWTGYILKEKANHYHSLYERAGNQNDINHYWEKMEMYDLMGNTGYVVSGIFSSLLIKELIFK
ncbi:MAG: hypothetical protein Kow00108_08350 [Calditrichia bacterium]